MILKVKSFEDLKKQLYETETGNKDSYQIHDIAEKLWQHEFDNEKEEKDYFENREYAEIDISDMIEEKTKSKKQICIRLSQDKDIDLFIDAKKKISKKLFNVEDKLDNVGFLMWLLQAAKEGYIDA